MTRKYNRTTLGIDQEHVLTRLKRHGHWYPDCEWVHLNNSTTKRILDSLVTRGYARIEKRGSVEMYIPTEK